MPGLRKKRASQGSPESWTAASVLVFTQKEVGGGGGCGSSTCKTLKGPLGGAASSRCGFRPLAEHNLSNGSGPGDQNASYSAPWNERLKGGGGRDVFEGRKDSCWLSGNLCPSLVCVHPHHSEQGSEKESVCPVLDAEEMPGFLQEGPYPGFQSSIAETPTKVGQGQGRVGAVGKDVPLLLQLWTWPQGQLRPAPGFPNF